MRVEVVVVEVRRAMKEMLDEGEIYFRSVASIGSILFNKIFFSHCSRLFSFLLLF